jgi:hypothetical protein
VLGKLVGEFLDESSNIRTENRQYVTKRDRGILDYVVKPSRCDLSFIATAFSNQSGDLGKVFGVGLVRAFAALSELAFMVQTKP